MIVLFYYCSAINPPGKTPSAAGNASDVPSRKGPITTSAITRYLAPKMLTSMRDAARRRYVLWCATNLSLQTMRYDEGYKLHVVPLVRGNGNNVKHHLRLDPVRHLNRDMRRGQEGPAPAPGVLHEARVFWPFPWCPAGPHHCCKRRVHHVLHRR